MANELTRTINLNFTKGGVTDNVSYSEQVTVTGSRMIHAVQNIGITKEAINIGELASAGCYVIKNLDATNFVELFPDATGLSTNKALAGEVMTGRFGASSQAPQMKADTAGCLCDIRIWET